MKLNEANELITNEPNRYKLVSASDLEYRKHNLKEYFKYQFQLSAYHWLNSDLNLKPFGQIIFHLTDGGGLERYPVYSMHQFPLLPHEEIEEFIINYISELHQHLNAGTLPLCTNEERGYQPGEWKLQRISPTNGKMRTVNGSKHTNEADFRSYCKSKARPCDQEVITEPTFKLCEYCSYSSICTQE